MWDRARGCEWALREPAPFDWCPLPCASPKAAVYLRVDGRMIDDSIEARFIERLRARDERAFNELVKQYERRVFGLLLRLIGRRDEAEDLAQEVFVQVFKAIGGFRGDAKLS